MDIQLDIHLMFNLAVFLLFFFKIKMASSNGKGLPELSSSQKFKIKDKES